LFATICPYYSPTFNNYNRTPLSLNTIRISFYKSTTGCPFYLSTIYNSSIYNSSIRISRWIKNTISSIRWGISGINSVTTQISYSSSSPSTYYLSTINGNITIIINTINISITSSITNSSTFHSNDITIIYL